MAGYYLTPELAKEADDIAREQYKSHIHPATEPEGKTRFRHTG